MHTQVEDRRSTLTERSSARHKRTAVIVAAVVTAVLIAGFLIGRAEWPFTRGSIVQALQEESGASVQIAQFHETYFPPGCVSDGVTFHRANEPAGAPFITIRKLTIVSNYPGLLRHHVSTIRADGLHIRIATAATNGNGGGSSLENLGKIRSKLTIGQIIADGSQVEFLPNAGRPQPLIFNVRKLTLHDLANGQPMSFESMVDLPEPSAQVRVSGKFGPFDAGKTGQTALSGNYTVQNLNLIAFNGVAGSLAGQGTFNGILRQVTVDGSADVPQFEVKGSSHNFHLVTQYRALVNGVNGDVQVEGVRAHFGQTTISGAGSVANIAGQNGKTAKLYFYSQQAQIQDLFNLFIHEDKSPIVGAVIFRTVITIPPGQAPFLHRVQSTADFGIKNARYPDPKTQQTIDTLSARARGNADQVEDAQDKQPNYDPGRVMSDLKGNVALNNGVAHFSNLSFNVPGATAHLAGTYDLDNYRMDLRGHMSMETDLSKATTGVKSFLLKIVQPFMHHSKKGKSWVAIHIGGTYHKPTYTVNPLAEK